LFSSRGVAPGLSEPTIDAGTERLVAAIIGGDRVATAALGVCTPDALWACAEAHRVLPLLAERLSRRGDVPPRLRSRCREASARHAAADLLREIELQRVLRELVRAAVPALLIKGAHLAYGHYPRPDLRPRLDTDIVIPSAARGAADRTLVRIGYALDGHVSGELVMYQAPYVNRRAGTVFHTIDVHWKIANAQAFADLLSYEELAAASVPLPRLGAAARGLSDVHALALACVHRVAHHFDSGQMIWLYDIHLLASRLDRHGWDLFAGLAIERGVAAVCRQSLTRTMQTFATAVPSDLLARLQPRARAAAEPTAVYLQPHRRHVEHVVSDLRALPTWTRRWRLVREHAFPPAQYMRKTYAPASAAPLPILYARRAIRGARKWLARS
jgi:hypothetical protein